ncbi:MAG: hypothetical protein ACOYON_10925 [Fimbriimonas sp.]
MRVKNKEIKARRHRKEQIQKAALREILKNQAEKPKTATAKAAPKKKAAAK